CSRATCTMRSGEYSPPSTAARFIRPRKATPPWRTRRCQPRARRSGCGRPPRSCAASRCRRCQILLLRGCPRPRDSLAFMPCAPHDGLADAPTLPRKGRDLTQHEIDFALADEFHYLVDAVGRGAELAATVHKGEVTRNRCEVHRPIERRIAAARDDNTFAAQCLDLPHRVEN